VNVDEQPGHLTVPLFEARMKCAKCQSRKISVRRHGIRSRTLSNTLAGLYFRNQPKAAISAAPAGREAREWK
jgi:hypothetical protein